MEELRNPQASEIKAIFNKIAPVYDQMNNWLSLGIHRIWKLMAVKWSEPSPGDVGLDLCCGSGDLTFLLASQIMDGQVFGVDFSAELLAIARQKVPCKSLPSTIAWIEADVLSLPFDNNYFDCATMGYGLRNVLDIPRCLTELYRVLKPEAKAAILDFHHPSNPIMSSFQQWYLHNIVVPTASNVGFPDEYAYISPSLDRFPSGGEQIKLAEEAGFTEAVHYSLFGGMMGVLVLSK
jgi:demethylmenaquinone methyltransferase/2-methoxy-6-polyprenyl-1,4-benzoquinol methylase